MRSSTIVHPCASIVRILGLAALLAGGTCRLAAQHTWVVDADNRPGTDFTATHLAIAAAAPGDTIRLRVPSANTYAAPALGSTITTITKPLFIIGEVGPVLPRVRGFWELQNIPAGATFLLANIEILGGVGALSCPGCIVLDNIKITEPQAAPTVAAGFTDCGLGVISHSNIHCHGGVYSVRSTLMIDDTTVHSHNYPAAGFYTYPDNNFYTSDINTEGRYGTSAIVANQGTVIVSNSTLIGASATVQPYGLNAFNALDLSDASITIGKGCAVDSGSTLGGLLFHLNNGSGVSSLHVDPATVVNSSWRADLVQFSQAPLNGMRWTLSPGTLQIAHYANRQSISAVAIGPVATPWSTTAGIALGPVCIDPTAYSEYWDVTNLLGIASRTFAIPPGLPVGYQVALQCFELMPSGTINTSNAAVVQIRP